MVGFGIVIEGSMQYQDVRQLSTYHESMNICCYGRVNYLPRIHKYGVVLDMLFSTYLIKINNMLKNFYITYRQRIESY